MNVSFIVNLAIAAFIIGIPGQAIAQKKVTFSTSEAAPYIGKKLPNQGYVSEVVTEAFKRVGYQVEFKFYPLARAKKLARQGETDGFLPSDYANSLEKYFLFSDSFSANKIGLLKKRSLPVNFSIDPRKQLTASLKTLQKYNFGIQNGASIITLFNQAALNNIQLVNNGLQQLDMIEKGRIHFAVIDQYAAADIMVNQRPHLIGQLEFMGPPLIEKDVHVAFSKATPNYEQLNHDFNRGIKALQQDGGLEEILVKHGFFPKKAKVPGKTKLTIGTVDNVDMHVMQKLSRQFEEIHPNIELKWKILDESILRKRLLSDLAISDGQFDIISIGAHEASLWAEQGWLAPIQGLPETYDIQDLIDSVRDTLSSKGKLYALPFYAESSMTYYRKDLFQKAGIKMPAQPTYEDIKKFAAYIHNPEEQVYGICLRGKAGWGANMTLIGTLVNTYGGQWFNNKWEPQLNTPEWQNAVSMYKELLTRYGPPNPMENNFNENLSLFSNGHCGIWIDATVAGGVLFNPELSEVHDLVSFAPAPISKTTKGSNWLWTWALAIPSSSKNKKTAMEFITWATSKNYIQQVADNQGWIAVPPGTRKSTYTNEHYLTAAPFADFVFQAIQDADPVDSTLKPKPYKGIQTIDIKEFPAIGDKVGLNIAKAINGEMSVNEALIDAQQFVEKQMKKSGFY